ncbi:MAG: hypothetical protein KGZ43_04480 [Sulfuritalea sp.]|nr:hypothetical protein [Sulfuritalea sp.]
MNWPNETCDHYWEHADWLPPWYILDRWCQRDDRCRQAKYEALLTACERGDVKYGRRDGKDFDDPVRELAERRILIIERTTFDAWATRLDGQSPLAAPPRPMAPLPPKPTWAKPTHSPTSSIAAVADPGNRQTIDDAPEQESDDDSGDGPAPITAARPNLTPPAGDVPSDEIIAAFPVVADEKENTEWWKKRMREAKDYGLTDARTYAGRLREQSRWQPNLIAFWLVDKGYMKAKVVKRIITRSFPDWADSVDYFIVD